MKIWSDGDFITENIWLSNYLINDMKITWDVKPNKYYTLLIYDKDSINACFLNELRVNIPFNNLLSGDIIMRYIKPSGTFGVNRIVILVLEQSEKYNPVINQRMQFNPINYVKLYNLRTVELKYIIVDKNINKICYKNKLD